MARANGQSKSWLGRYCVICEGRQVTFAQPASFYESRLVMRAIFLGFAAVALAFGINDAMYQSVNASLTIPFGIGFFLLILAAVAYSAPHVNEVTFDLKRRTYQRIVYAPLPSDRTLRHRLLGRRWRRWVVTGFMDEIAGVRIHEQQRKHRNSYALRLVWKDKAEPPMPVGVALSGHRAQELAAEIATALALPVLEMDARS